MVSHGSQCPGQQPGHVHLRNAQLLADLGLGQVAEEAQRHDPLRTGVARWISSSPPRRTLDTAERLQRLLAHCPELDHTHTLVRAFAAMFDTGDPQTLPDWLNELEASRLPGLPSLARVIREDLPTDLLGNNFWMKPRKSMSELLDMLAAVG
jgi:hypothetical protein